MNQYEPSTTILKDGTPAHVYPPTRDWAGIGYNHWMVCRTEGQSGVGESFEEAVQDLLNHWPIA